MVRIKIVSSSSPAGEGSGSAEVPQLNVDNNNSTSSSGVDGDSVRGPVFVPASGPAMVSITAQGGKDEL